MVICLKRGVDLHTARLMPLPLTVSCFSKIQTGFTFLVPAHLGSPGKGPLNGCVCVFTFQVLSSTLSVFKHFQGPWSFYSKFKHFQGFLKHTMIRVYFFSQRVINRWNNLSQEDVDAQSINCFQNRLEKRRIQQMDFLKTYSLLVLSAARKDKQELVHQHWTSMPGAAAPGNYPVNTCISRAVQQFRTIKWH